MGELLDTRVETAVAAMRTGTDEVALRALVELAAEPPTDVLAALVDRLMTAAPARPSAGPVTGRLPDTDTVDQVMQLVENPRNSALIRLGGGTYDGLLALLVATLAAVSAVPDAVGP